MGKIIAIYKWTFDVEDVKEYLKDVCEYTDEELEENFEDIVEDNIDDIGTCCPGDDDLEDIYIID